MIDDSTTEQERYRRLRWQCRRGMLELDLLLSRFLDAAYADLTKQQRRDFVHRRAHSGHVGGG